MLDLFDAQDRLIYFSFESGLYRAKNDFNNNSTAAAAAAAACGMMHDRRRLVWSLVLRIEDT